jgi:DNA-binding transcriptional MerR regulator
VNELYSIGDVARRTGLSVSAIRFYADQGVVAPSGLTEGGFRRYDVHAIARLEFVRTLRDLGAGLEDIRRVLVTETTLHVLAAAHLRVAEEQLQQFRARRETTQASARGTGRPASGRVCGFGAGPEPRFGRGRGDRRVAGRRPTQRTYGAVNEDCSQAVGG